MAHSNLLGGDSIAVQPDGRSAEALGTSGNSDSGSDVVGTLSRASDATGTGEQSDVERDNAAAASDIRPDRVRGSEGLQAPGTAAREIDQLASDDDAAPGEDPSV